MDVLFMTMQDALDYEAVTADFLRVLRGRRSQMGLSRVLGYRSNIVYRWESGQCWPTAAAFLARCRKLDIDIGGALVALIPRRRQWLAEYDPASPGGLAAFLDELRSGTPIGELARAAGVNRFTVSRWLKGSAQPRLPDFFRMVEAASRRLLDLLSHWVDPERLPSARAHWRRLERARRLAYEQPWAHAVLRVLQLTDYREGPARETRWIADRLGVASEEVERGLAALQRSGQIVREHGRWLPQSVERVDTGKDPERARALKLHWTHVAVERAASGGPGSFGYSLFEVSRADLQKLAALHVDYVRAMQHIVSNSRGTECIGLYCAQLFDLAARDNALAPVGTADHA
jgi:transcriptional regulator with XRE-family HTH domain